MSLCPSLAELRSAFPSLYSGTYYTDIKPDNFLFKSDGLELWIIDFQHISVLPEVFQSYAYFNIGLPFAAEVGKRLKHQPSSKANAMVPISNVIQASG
ncbi:hypothetical protein FRC11_011497 [Ceratobasidium sp. 423]|nr:hypothetical protein FRC11_011497 [Ceratobasidium sp. 423]